MAKAQINYEDDFTVEDETALSRLEERDRAPEVSSGDIYKTGAYAGMMLPSAGIADYFGQYPNPEEAGTLLPSFDENVNKGEYFNAAMQFLGAAGDASYTIPTIGTVTGTGLKALALGGKLSKVQLSKLMDGIGAYMTRTNDPMLAMAGGPNLNIGPSITKMEGPPSGGSKVPDDLNLGSGSLFNPEVKKGRKLLIVSCSADKCPDPGDMEAFDRYTGDMYKSMKKIGVPEENVDLAIMSAKYGLIRRDTQIPHYNVKMDKEIASNLLKDSTQVNRIKNTIDGYDEVVVEGSNLYKGVIKEAAGDAPLRDFKIDYEKTLLDGERSNYGSGRQKQSVGNFLRSNTPVDVYHYSPAAELGFTIFEPNKSPNALDALGTHVGTAKAARDRFKSLQGMELKSGSDIVTGNLGRDEAGNFIRSTTRGGTYPLKANLSNPYTPDKFYKGQVSGAGPSKEVWGESDIYDHLLDEYNKDRGTKYTMRAMVGDEADFPFPDFRKFIGEFRLKIAEDGFTHLPYYNEVEDYGSMSYVMLTDRPKDSAAVLKGKFGKNDTTQRTNPDIMKEDGGVISLKDKAVNMNRGPRGIEPYVQYMKDGGVVDRVLTYFGYGDEPPTETRNIFEEQREVAEKERFRPTVEEGIARAEEGRYQDERLAGYDQEGPLMRMIAARIRKKNEQPFTPFEKNLGLQDDPYAKKPPVPSTYQTGVEFGDTEVGFDLLGQLDFNKVLLAGLTDNRTLSDFVKTPKRDDDDSYKALQMSKAYYQGKDNIIQMSPLSVEDNFNSTLTHELMHKGADLLEKASGKDLEKLRKTVMSKGRMSQAEHRYIQSIVNKAYVDRMLLNESVFSRSQLADYEAFAKKRPNDSFYKKQIKNYKKDLQGDRNETLLSEAKRVFELYMTKENREKFISRVTPFLEENKISSFFLTKDYDYNKIADIFDIMPFRDSMAIFDTANSIMAEDHITQKFAETMKNAKSSRLTKDYDSYFPEQIPPNFDLYTPEAKAEGGVIGLKDRAVKMHRNVV